MVDAKNLINYKGAGGNHHNLPWVRPKEGIIQSARRERTYLPLVRGCGCSVISENTVFGTLFLLILWSKKIFLETQLTNFPRRIFWPSPNELII